MIDISADIAKHIAISGLQSIYITDKSNCLINDGEHNQEAWRISAAASASARLLQKVEAAGPPDPTIGSGRYAPNRGCQRS
jgi:hypothetical protein